MKIISRQEPTVPADGVEALLSFSIVVRRGDRARARSLPPPPRFPPGAAEALERAAAERGVRLSCHLKIDTGMNRLGFRHDNLPRTVAGLARSPHLHVEAAYTHFATADDHETPLFFEQRERFEAAPVFNLARLQCQ